jgi:predicted  nucleic acid-binding Zn-ribbon protein
MDNDGKNTIQELRSRVNTLIELHESAKNQVVQLEDENQQLKKELKQKEEELAGCREKMSTMELAKGIASAESTHDAKIKINRIVREIDKCIALLNK